MLDLLENRALLSTVTFTSGKIRIEGTSGNDVVHVAKFSKSQGQVIDNGNVALTFNLNAVSGISFNGGNGNDLITIGRVNIKSYLVGGAGNDSLSCSEGAASDTILGGNGSDYLYGGGGIDSLIGGAAGDTILGGSGNDTIIPLSEQNTDDFISGGAGFDTVNGVDYPNQLIWVIGEANPDPDDVNDTILGDVEIITGSKFNDRITVISGRSVRLDGSLGNDTLLTGRGDDTITGGGGTDSIATGGGADEIFAFDTQVDTINGGTGLDTAHIDSFEVRTGIDVEDIVT